MLWLAPKVALVLLPEQGDFVSYGKVSRLVTSGRRLYLHPSGKVWVGLTGKLAAFEPQEQVLTMLHEADGLNQPEFSLGQRYKQTTERW